MNDLFNTLLGLNDPGLGDEGVAFGFARPLAAWGWALVVLAAAGIAAAGYARLSGPRLWRGGLAAVRAATLVVVAVLAAGPHLVRQPITVVPDTVLMLVDRSGSLGVRDGGDGRSRDEQLRQILDGAAPAFAELAAQRSVLWLGMDAGAFPLLADAGGTGAPETAESPETAATSPIAAALGAADGSATRLGAAIEQALDRLGGKPVAGIVVLSDGRSADVPSRALLRRLTSGGVPVFAVPLGSPGAVGDVSVARVEAPAVVFPEDLVPVRVSLEASGGTGAGEAQVIGQLDLIDDATGRVLATEEVRGAALTGGGDGAGDGGRGSVTLLARPASEGAQRWRVVYRPAGEDLIDTNNSAEAALRAESRPLRVLYIDGYPRWEQRYLKSLLIREASITVSAVLVASDRRYTQEGDELVTTLPVSPEEWAVYDVVIVGDARAEVFGREQLLGLRAHVLDRGAGLLWLAGPAAMPQGWLGSAAADLLPMRGASAGGSTAPDAALRLWDVPVTLRPTEAARQLGLFSIGAAGSPAALPDEVLDPSLGWTRLQWAQRIDPATLKPAVAVLAEATAGGDDAPTPLTLLMRAGAGRVVYVGTDELWRWRYGRGEALYERFWLPLIRSLGRDALARSEGGAVLTIAPTIAELGRPASVTLEVFDPALVDGAPGRVGVEITGPGDAGATLVTLTREAAEGTTRVSYSGSWSPATVGGHEARVIEPGLAGAAEVATATVIRADDELRRPQADHAALAELAAATEGRVLTGEELGAIAELLPNRSRVVAGPRDVTTLWDRPQWLVLLLVLLAAEWIGRRVIKLV